jgi:hypothetical protein
MSLSEQLATDMANVFLNEDELAEPVIYVKKTARSGQSARRSFATPWRSAWAPGDQR